MIASNKVHHVVVLVELVHLMYILLRLKTIFFRHFGNQIASKNVEKKFCFQIWAICTSNEPARRVLQGGALYSTILLSLNSKMA